MKCLCRHFVLTAISLSLLIALLDSAHAQMLLNNGSFESPALSSGSDVSGSGNNWTTTGSAYVYTNGNGSGTTPYGSQWEYLFSSATDAQTLGGTLALNQPYTLSLVAADVFGTTGDQLTIAVSGGATASQSFAIPKRTNPGAGALPFATYSLTFTPTSNAAVTVTLSNSGGATIAVDNVQVPEPSVWAMLGVGVGGVGVMALRRVAPNGPG